MAGPAHRPPRLLRGFVALLGLVALAFNAVLMLADRAPGLANRIGGAAIRRLFERIDADPAVLADPRLPESDSLVHVAVWAVAVVLVGWALWSWIGLFVGAAAVFGSSLVIEVLQGRLSDTREVEARDALANLGGVALGTAFVVLCYLAYSAVAIVVGGISRGPRSYAAPPAR